MNHLPRPAIVVFVLLGLTACGNPSQPELGSAGEDRPEQTDEGPHGGRLLRDGDFQVEITIFEKGVAPEFRVYAYQEGMPVDPAEIMLTVELSRLGGRVERFSFEPRHDYLLGSGAVREPHSFDVTVGAEYRGQRHDWSYAAYEGRTRIAPEVATTAGVVTAVAGPRVLRQRLSLYGTIQPDQERVRHVTARFPGVIRAVNVRTGDRVPTGATLATVESNESLQVYAVKAPIRGVITQRSANPGEVAGDAALFVLADFSSVWAEFNVFPRDRAQLAPGQNVVVVATDGKTRGEGSVRYVSPAGGTGGSAPAQTLSIRVALDNHDDRWTPGLFVTGAVTVAESAVPLAVPLPALQTFRDWRVVFVNFGDIYEARPLELGRDDSDYVEVLSGLAAGERYVVANSYLIKADIEKSGASHDH